MKHISHGVPKDGLAGKRDEHWLRSVAQMAIKKNDTNSPEPREVKAKQVK